MANTTTNFLPTGPNWKSKKISMIASVVIAEGAAVYAVGDGTHTKVTNTTTNFIGITAEPIAAADSDYATSLKQKLAYIPMNSQAEAIFTVGSGTFTPADVGDTVKFSDEISLALDVAGIQARITAYISPTRGKCVFNQDIV